MNSSVKDKGGRVGSLGILQLRKFKDLFRDDAAYAAFISAMRTSPIPGSSRYCSTMSSQSAGWFPRKMLRMRYAPESSAD